MRALGEVLAMNLLLWIQDSQFATSLLNPVFYVKFLIIGTALALTSRAGAWQAVEAPPSRGRGFTAAAAVMLWVLQYGPASCWNTPSARCCCTDMDIDSIGHFGIASGIYCAAGSP
jgi:hypothetical protein